MYTRTYVPVLSLEHFVNNGPHRKPPLNLDRRIFRLRRDGLRGLSVPSSILKFRNFWHYRDWLCWINCARIQLNSSLTVRFWNLRSDSVRNALVDVFILIGCVYLDIHFGIGSFSQNKYFRSEISIEAAVWSGILKIFEIYIFLINIYFYWNCYKINVHSILLWYIFYRFVIIDDRTIFIIS